MPSRSALNVRFRCGERFAPAVALVVATSDNLVVHAMNGGGEVFVGGLGTAVADDHIAIRRLVVGAEKGLSD
jgi:hypothetical protein